MTVPLRPRELSSRRALRRVLVACALSLAMTACAGEAPQQEGVVRSDSAGVRIIVNTGADKPLAWQLDSVDVLRDSLGEPWLFTRVSTRTVITDRAGRSYVLEPTERTIRRFGRDGRYEMSIGRQGGGPGEMQGPSELLQQGDSLVVFDGGRQTLVRWNSQFEPINDLPLRGTLERVNRLAFRFGGVWVQRTDFDSTGSSSGLYLDTLATEPWFKLQHPRPSAADLCGRQVAFVGGGYFATTQVWTHRGPRMLAVRGPAYDLWLFEGPRPLASVRRDIAVRAPTPADVERLFPDGLQLAGCPMTVQEMAEKVGMSPTMPLVNDVSLLSDGTIWVQRSLRTEQPVLDVFGSDGAYAGTLSGYHLPVGILPNDEVLIPRDDEESGGIVIQRTRIVR